MKRVESIKFHLTISGQMTVTETTTVVENGNTRTTNEVHNFSTPGLHLDVNAEDVKDFFKAAIGYKKR